MVFWVRGFVRREGEGRRGRAEGHTHHPVSLHGVKTKLDRDWVKEREAEGALVG